MSDWQQTWSDVMANNYGTPPIQIVSGSGCRVTDSQGKVYLDLLAGIATSSLGHAHPAIVEAVTQQVATLSHTSNLYAHPTGLQLASRLTELVGQPARVFFCQDGATANEAALKIARRHGRAKNPEQPRTQVISTHGSFHGRTMGALAVTGSPGKREPFEPLVPDVCFVEFGDVDALAKTVNERTEAVIVEPIQGENGVVVPDEGWLSGVREICTNSGALMIVDEVQSGIGRTGQWLASIGSGVRPDVITVAKGLAGGLPLGACIALDDAADLLQPGDHGSTFGGNPVSCAAALAVLDTIESDELLTHVVKVGNHLQHRVEALQHPLLAGQRGVGLWRGLLLTEPVGVQVQTQARQAGFLINAAASDVIRLAPPLIVTTADIDEFFDALPAILDAVAEQSAGDAV